jgi:hypothetical protein
MTHLCDGEGDRDDNNDDNDNGNNDNGYEGDANHNAGDDACCVGSLS